MSLLGSLQKQNVSRKRRKTLLEPQFWFDKQKNSICNMRWSELKRSNDKNQNSIEEVSMLCSIKAAQEHEIFAQVRTRSVFLIKMPNRFDFNNKKRIFLILCEWIEEWDWSNEIEIKRIWNSNEIERMNWRTHSLVTHVNLTGFLVR